MILRKLNATGPWDVTAIVDGDGTCSLALEFEQMRAQPATAKVVDALVAMFDRVPREGPSMLPDQQYHQLRGPIYEFRKKRYRVLCFQGDGRLIVCSHIMLKRSQAMPPSEIARAQRLHEAYQQAVREGAVVVDRGN